MTRINWKRVGVGGLIAGLVINVVQSVLTLAAFRQDWESFTDLQLAIFTLLGFLTGLVAVWLYAAILPRYGAGSKTAVIAGLAVWLPGFIATAVVATALWDIVAVRFQIAAYWITCLAEMPIATLLGARFYSIEP